MTTQPPTTKRRTAPRCFGLLALLAAAASLLAHAPAALAAAPPPQWSISSYHYPTNFAPGGSGEYALTVTNSGGSETDNAQQTTITDTLPAGLTATGVDFYVPYEGNPYNLGAFLCTTAPLQCEYPKGFGGFLQALPPGQQLEMVVHVEVEASAAEGTLANSVTVAGGGAASTSLSEQTVISATPPPFGVEHFDGSLTNEDGSADTQAGSHPYQVTTTFALNTATRSDGLHVAGGDLKDLRVDTPPGLIGNPTALPTCSETDFFTVQGANKDSSCANNTVIGFLHIAQGSHTSYVPVYNVEPPAGVVAEFGAMVTGTPVLLQASVRSGSDYGVTLTLPDVSQALLLTGSTLTLWGVPADPSHDPLRGQEYNDGGQGLQQICGLNRSTGASMGNCPTDAAPKPYLTLPTSCTGPLPFSLAADSWATPGIFATDSFLTHDSANPIGLERCDRLLLNPAFSAKPTTDLATAPSGLDVNLDIADEGLTAPKGIAQSQVRKTVVTLPEGFTLNPSAGEGLGVCTPADYGRETATSAPGEGCPNSSKLGEVTIKSPLLEKPLQGSLFIAQPNDPATAASGAENPFDSLLALYIVAKLPERGILVKLPGKVEANPVTGQLTTTFDNLPQLPFAHFNLHFREGQRAPLISPPACGPYTAEAEFTPWSAPTQTVPGSSTFTITRGSDGGACPAGGLPPFHPELLAGSLNDAAGAYTPFYIRISRRDSEQEITHFSIKLPPGVIGKLAGIPLCTDAQIAQAKAREHEGGGAQEEQNPSCPVQSEVGRTIVETGVGSVLAKVPGRVYLAGPYHGAPISVVAITAAKVGPFDIGTVVVREALKVNPETGEVFVDATGSDPIPHIVDGIPTHLRTIRIYMDRPEFVLNPTSCEPTSTASTVLGSGLNFASEADDQPVTVTSPFQAADCAALPFHPRLSLKLLGSAKRAAHPALRATLKMNGIGEAAISKAQVTLPRSEFLENAHIRTVCTRVQFKEGNGNGEKCPPGSIYGFARAKTPLLSEPLEGPVYLRSNGGERKLPDLVAALHAQEINVDLVGRIDSLHGQIRNTFEAVPDAPVESFTLEMQGGNKGLLVNSENLCNGTHRAIVDFTAHNGKVSDAEPAVGAQCSARKHKHKRRHKRAHRHR